MWNAQDAPDINAVIDSLLEAGKTIVAATGLWDQPRLGPPPKGSARVSVLTPGGLHFGQGPQEALWADPLSKPALDRAQALMLALIQYAKR